jgi:hypothetical protein
MLSSAINTLKDPDASGWEKLSSVIMSAAMAIIMLNGAYKAI